MAEQRGSTTMADEMADVGPRIARALLTVHGDDKFYLGRAQDQFAAKLEACFYCKYFKRGECKACAVVLFVLVEIEKHLGKTLPLPLDLGEQPPAREEPLPAQVSP